MEHTALLRQAPKAPLSRLWEYARVHWRMLVLGGVLTFLGGVTGLVQPLMAKYVIDALGEGATIAGPITALLAVVLAGAVIGALGAFVLERTGHSGSRRGQPRWMRPASLNPGPGPGPAPGISSRDSERRSRSGRR